MLLSWLYVLFWFIIKLNISKKLKERKLISNINKKSFIGLKKSDIKSKIFLLQRKKINNNFNITNKLLKKKELKEYNEYLILNRNNRLNVSEQKRNKVKTKYNSIIKKNKEEEKKRKEKEEEEKRRKNKTAEKKEI